MRSGWPSSVAAVPGSCGGPGKTTLARELGTRVGIEVVHLDGLYYGPDWNAAA